MQNKGNLIDLLANAEIRKFISANKDEDVRKMALSAKSHKFSSEMPAILEIISIYQKAKAKLPHWVEKFAAMDKKSYEQSSSEATAIRKSELIDGESLLNICGGLGIDDWAFSKRINKIVSVENDSRIHQFAEYNLQIMECDNVERLCQSAEEFLEINKEKFTWLYADPDRRVENLRVSDLSDSAPDVVALWPKLLQTANNIIIKASPMIGIFEVLKTLPDINNVVVIALKNEVKEVLFIYEESRKGEEVIHTGINLGDNSEMFFSATPVTIPVSDIGEVGFFYEPNTALIKSGLAGAYAQNIGSVALIPGASYQYSSELFSDFQGRKFRILKVIRYARKVFDKYLSEAKIKKANFARRNFRQSVEELRKLHKISDGGEHYFFFYQDINGQSMAVHCERL